MRSLAGCGVAVVVVLLLMVPPDGVGHPRLARTPSTFGPFGSFDVGRSHSARPSIPGNTSLSSFEWANLTGFGPDAPNPGRGDYGLAYDPVDHYLVLFGGESSGGYLNDTWVWDNRSWTELETPVAPSQRYDPSMAWDSTDGYVVLFGGSPGTNIGSNDTWTFLHGTWKELTNVVAPAERYEAALVDDPADGQMVLFGGSYGGSGNYYNDTWSFVAGNWTELYPTASHAPAPRRGMAAGYDPADGSVVVFGGTDYSFTPMSDTWRYQNNMWSQLSTSSSPGGRWLATASFDPTADALVVNGGTNVQGCVTVLGDTWTLSGGNWTSRTGFTNAPPARCGDGMAYDPDGSGDVFFGFGNATWGFTPDILVALHAPGTADAQNRLTLRVISAGGGVPLGYSYGGLPPGCSTANLSTLVCTPTVPGSYEVTVRATDPQGRTGNGSANFTLNTAPAVTLSATAPTVDQGHAIEFDGNASGGTQVYHWQYWGLPAGCTGVNNSTLSCAPTAIGNYTVSVTITDSAGGVGVSNALHLRVVGRPTVGLAINRTSDDVGLAVELTATPTGGTGPIDYVWSGLPNGCNGTDAPALSCLPSQTGNFSPQVKLTDADGFSAVRSTTLNVNPQLTVTGFTGSPTVPDAGQPLTVTVTTSGGTGPMGFQYYGLPTGCPTENSSQLTCSPPTSGSLDLDVLVTDALGQSANRTLHLSVTPAPSLTGFVATPGAVDLGQSVGWSSEVSGGLAPLTFTYSNLPPGCLTSDHQDLNCTPAAAGVFDVQLTVTDALGARVSSVARTEVNKLPRVVTVTGAPTLLAPGETTVLAVLLSGGTSPFHFAWVDLPTGCATRDSGNLTCVPSGVGSFNVTVEATDATNVSAVGSVIIDVQTSSGGPVLPSSSSGLPYLLVGLLAAALLVAVVLLVLRRSRGSRGTVPEPPRDPLGPEADEGGEYGLSQEITETPTDPGPGE